MSEIIDALKPSCDMAKRANVNLSNMKAQYLSSIGERLITQDNRMTQNPMFCVQIKVRDTGLDTAYSDHICWVSTDGDGEVVYKEPKNLNDWTETGCRDRWETVMVAFTEAGCQEYLELDGHNCRSRAQDGEVRIYVESFNRCPEMIAIREALMEKGQP